MDPKQLLYSETHEWVHVEKDPSGAKVALVGITAFALEALTDLVYIDLPEAGRQVEAGQPFGEVESVKAVSDLNSPVEGEVLEANLIFKPTDDPKGEKLAKALELLTKDPYGEGWLVKIRIADESGLAKLMDYAAYQRQCEKEAQEH